MRIFILLFVLAAFPLFAQENIPLTGRHEETINENGVLKTRTITAPEPNSGTSPYIYSPYSHSFSSSISNIRWTFQDPAGIGSVCEVSGNNKYSVVGWDLNFERISVYGNVNSTPLWEYTTGDAFKNNVVISDTGGRIAAGSLYNILIFNNGNTTPIFNYDLTTRPDTGIAGPIDITKNGSFIVASVSRSDSSTILGFNAGSTTPVWSFKVIPQISTGGAGLQGIKMSGNDSIVIANTYAEFFVLNTFTGQLLYRGAINPTTTSSGTQFAQGISGNGSVIATINYSGHIRVYKWNGTTYIQQWLHAEPGSWMSAVDITYDGNFVACGTLNFLGGSNYDGKVKVFHSTSSTPIWTHTGSRDEITAVSFSKSGNILAASTWGAFDHSTDDLLIFKTFQGNVPIYAVNTPGSFFYCNTSADGRTVITSGKAIHARAFGNGGLAYNIEVDTNDTPTSIISNIGTVNSYKLHQNYPNPFNPVTKISFDIPSASQVKLVIYDASGRMAAELFNGNLQQGSHIIDFDGKDFSSGVYYYTLTTENFTSTKKMILIK